MDYLTLRNVLLVDAVSWMVYGAIWVLFPSLFLCANFGGKKFDWITIHMTESFGLLCLFSGIVSWMVYKRGDEAMVREMLRIKLLIEIILLGLMVTANKNNLLGLNVTANKNILGQVGAYGLVLCIALNFYVLCRN